MTLKQLIGVVLFFGPIIWLVSQSVAHIPKGDRVEMLKAIAAGFGFIGILYIGSELMRPL